MFPEPSVVYCAKNCIGWLDREDVVLFVQSELVNVPFARPVPADNRSPSGSRLLSAPAKVASSRVTDGLGPQSWTTV